MNRVWLGGALLGLACSASSEPAPRASVRHERLAAGLAAKVGPEEVALATVSRIAAAQRVAPAVARERAMNDALFAAGARSRFGSGPIPAVAERAALARTLLESMKADALAHGPVTDAEVNELTAIRWTDFDRPETVRTTHAAALVKNPADDAKARAVAERIARAVNGVSDPARFIELAQAVPHDEIEVRAERLPALTLDGRSYFPDQPGSSGDRFDNDFSKGAFTLAPGQISGLVKSAFGYHVILCEARLPEKRMPLAERRAVLADQILSGRAERAKQELLARLNAATPVMIARSVADMTARVVVTE